MNILVYDTESDGLLHDGPKGLAATRIWCAVTKINDVVTEYGPDDIGKFIHTLAHGDSDTIIVAHNQIAHDLALMEKLYGYIHRGRVLDTLVMSRLLQPERQGRHSLDAWGERLGRPKPLHSCWSVFTPEMQHRCSEDVEINYLVYLELMKEAGMNEEELVSLPLY